MEEIKEKLDLILNSQILMQSEVIRLNSKMDSLDEKFEAKLEKTNQRIDALDAKFEQRFDTLEETLEEDRKEIGSIFNDIFKKISA